MSHAAGKIFGNKEMRLLMLGLDAAGKTSELACHCVIPRAVLKDAPVSSSHPLQAQVEPVCHDYSYRCVFIVLEHSMGRRLTLMFRDVQSVLTWRR